MTLEVGQLFVSVKQAQIYEITYVGVAFVQFDTVLSWDKVPVLNSMQIKGFNWSVEKGYLRYVGKIR